MPVSRPVAETHYTVVARRYRPQVFDELVGQVHVVTALGNAIRQNRVGHAYLFTGARGVGKTSAARIFAKCLNCVTGPTATPCNTCDVCRLVATGEDIDVIEIDGASNRGIDEIRELRSNAGVRPSRAPYKIYIIDEVHMLTGPAFNALLKTLEEPPPHVRFIFCTTDPQKIPVTVVSRCQRFDFLPVETGTIARRLAEIATAEGVAADAEALELLARRAGGSMRDSQSLLEQLLGGTEGRITAADVNGLLGTTDLTSVAAVVRAIAASDPGGGLKAVHAAIAGGADPARLALQLVGYVRDLMALKTGCDADVLLHVMPGDLAEARELTAASELEHLLATLQILDSATVQMQSSPHARILLEAATVRAATLQNVRSMTELLAAAHSAALPANAARAPAPVAAAALPKPVVAHPLPAESLPAKSPPAESPPAELPAAIEKEHAPPPVEPKKKPVAAASDGEPAGPLDQAHATGLWQQLIARLDEAGDMLAGMVSGFSRVEAAADNLVTVTLTEEYNCRLCRDEARKKRLEAAFAGIAGRHVRLDFRFDTAAATSFRPAAQRLTRAEQQRQLAQNPLVRQLIETFDAEITDFQLAAGKRSVATDEKGIEPLAIASGQQDNTARGQI